MAVHTRPSGRQVAACVIAATSLFVALAGAKLVELVLKATNPDRVDVTQGLAYLRPVLLTTVGLLIVAVGVTVAVILRLSRAEGSSATRLPWTLFAA